MHSHIKINQAIPEPVIHAIRHIEQQGHVVWLVGGCVRDLMRGQHPDDFDLATDATPDQVAAMFDHHALTGYAHGTVTVFWQHMPLEVTTFRSESEYIDGRRPSQVSYHRQIEQDLARRDFTINSMAYHPEKGLLDPFDGLADLRSGILRCVGNPDQRFMEDSLRLLRALRFSVTLNLTVSPDVIEAARQMSSRICNLSSERILSELRKIIGAPYPAKINAFAGTGVLAAAVSKLYCLIVDDRKLNLRLQSFLNRTWQDLQLIPLLLLAVRIEQSDDQKPVDRTGSADADHSGISIRDSLARWSEPTEQYALKRLLIRHSRVSKKEANSICIQLLWIGLRLLMPADKPLDTLQQRLLLRQLAYHYRLSGSEAVRLASAGQELLQQFKTSVMEDSRLELLLEDRYPELLIHTSQLSVSGRDLLALGLPQDPSIQLILERALSYVISNPGEYSKDRLIQICRQLIIPQVSRPEN